MKKIIVVAFLVVNLLLLSACQDTKYNDDLINVIFFAGNTGATVEPYLNLEAGNSIDEPDVPVREGYSFSGWYKDGAYEESWDFDNDVLGDKTIVLYAKWVPQVLDIFYDLNGGTMINETYPEVYTVGKTFVLPTARRAGYTFLAWYTYDWEDPSSTVPGDKGYQTVPQGITEDLYLYAHWDPIIVSVTFNTNYPVEGEGPARPNSQSTPYGVVIDFPVLEDTDEYVFLGWNNRADGEGVWYVNGEIFTRSQRLTLYGIWQIK